MKSPPLNRAYALQVGAAVATLFEGMAEHRKQFGKIARHPAREAYNESGNANYRKHREWYVAYHRKRRAQKIVGATSCQQPHSVV